MKRQSNETSGAIELPTETFIIALNGPVYGDAAVDEFPLGDGRRRQKIKPPRRAATPKPPHGGVVMSLDDFIRNVIDSGVMTAAGMHDYLDTFPPEKRPSDAEALARVLVHDQHLSKYQAVRLLSADTSGLVFGDCTILGKIGEGGMGQVFKARHCRLDRMVAVKVLSADTMDSDEAVKRFRQEVRVAAKLSHANIVTTHDAGEQDGQQFMVMEYVEGRDLATVIKSQGPLPIAQAIDCVLQAARGLQHAHSQGAIHRDIKPGNLLLANDGTIKVVDMGLARIQEPEEQLPETATLAERLTQRGQMLGTVDYMSPEQATDPRTADDRSDIYSLGCTLYRLVTARPMYEGKTAIAKLMCHYEAAIPSMRESAQEISRRLEQVFQQMVAKRPEDRYQSMTKVIADLEECLKAEESVLVDTVTLTPTGSGANGYSTPEQPTIDYNKPQSDSDSTPPSAAEPVSPGQPKTQRTPLSNGPLSNGTVYESGVTVANQEAAPAVAADPAVEQHANQKTLIDAPQLQMHVETKVSPSDKTVGPDTKTSCGRLMTEPEAAGATSGTSPTRSVSATTVVICAAIVGALIGGLAVAGVILFVW